MTAIFEEGSRRSFGTILADTVETAVYTCPDGNRTAYITWINVSDDGADARTITLRWSDDSEAATYTLGYQVAIAANAQLRLELDLVLDSEDTLLATASAAGMHVAVTVKEVAGRRT
jgi:hypothetical protein